MLNCCDRILTLACLFVNYIVYWIYILTTGKVQSEAVMKEFL